MCLLGVQGLCAEARTERIGIKIALRPLHLILFFLSSASVSISIAGSWFFFTTIFFFLFLLLSLVLFYYYHSLILPTTHIRRLHKNPTKPILTICICIRTLCVSVAGRQKSNNQLLLAQQRFPPNHDYALVILDFLLEDKRKAKDNTYLDKHNGSNPAQFLPTHIHQLQDRALARLLGQLRGPTSTVQGLKQSWWLERHVQVPRYYAQTRTALLVLLHHRRVPCFARSCPRFRD